jgi:hypothetical protein
MFLVNVLFPLTKTFPMFQCLLLCLFIIMYLNQIFTVTILSNAYGMAVINLR